MKNYLVFLTALLVLMVSISAKADVIPDLASYFTQKINQAQAAVCSEVDSVTGTDQVVQDLDLDLIPSVSFGINSVLSLTVSPELDFVFTPDSN